MNIITQSTFNQPMSALCVATNATNHTLKAYDVPFALVPGSPDTPIQDFTGFNAPNNSTCRAKLDWTSGAQAQGGKLGFFLNGQGTASVGVAGGKYAGYWSMCTQSRFEGSTAHYPWASGKHLHIGLKQRIGVVGIGPTAVAQTYIGIGLDYTVGGVAKHSEILVYTWDSRLPAETNDTPVRTDSHGTKFVGTGAKAGQRYATNFGATAFSGTGGNREAQFYVDITRANILNILADSGHSAVNPDSIRLRNICFQAELADLTQPNVLPNIHAQYGVTFEGQTVSIW